MTRALRSAVHDLRARRLRTTLTALSMLVGVLAVVGVSAADQLSTGYVVAAHEQLRGREATFALSTTTTAAEVEAVHDWHDGIGARIGPQAAAATVVVATAVRARPPATPSAPATDLTAHWVVGDVGDTYRRPLVLGTWARPGLTAAPAVTVNEAAATRLGVTTVPVTLPISDGPGGASSAVVTGVVADGGTEPTVYGWLRDAAAVWPGTVQAGSTTMYLTAGAGGQPAAAGVLRDAATVAGVPVPDNEVRRVDTVQEAHASAQVVRTAFTACAVVALLVAGIGILNIGLASLSERARELVVRRAVGARRIDVFGQVLGAHVLLALAVSGVAIGAVLVGVYVVAPALTSHTFIADPVTVPWAAVRNGAGAAVLTSLAGAAVPAVAATRLEVADALRS